jgi:ubiquinol-cytochrome c reductase iron-sulfur subunit
MLEQLASIPADNLKDANSDKEQQPEYAKNVHRSKREEIFVAVGICTHLGCSPTYYSDGYQEVVEGQDSGFYCPCHGSKFDMAGRVFSGVPAGANLQIPPYYFVDDKTILVGEDGETA